MGKKPLTTTEAVKQISGSYHRAFSGKDGKIVLDDLMKHFYDGKMDGPDINREVGQRDVVRLIKQRIDSYG